MDDETIVMTATELGLVLGISKEEVYRKLEHGELALMGIFNISVDNYRAMFRVPLSLINPDRD